MTDDRPNEFERRFLEHFDPQEFYVDLWFHTDERQVQWLLVSLTLSHEGRVRRTVRLDVDTKGIRGGDSPAHLNWDSGVRAEDARIDFSPPRGIRLDGDGVAVLGRAALEWFGEQNRQFDRGR